MISIMAICPFCRNKETVSNNSEDYYASHLYWGGGGQVYIYRPVQDPSLPDEIWHYRFVPDWRSTFVWASQYNNTGQVIQKRIERINGPDVMLISMDILFITPDSVFSVSPDISDSATFAFTTIPESRKSKLQLHYWDVTADSVRVILTKERSLTGRTEYEFEGRKYPAIEVRVDEILETETEGFTTTKWTGTEVYAQGLGLVYYRKPINEALELEYELSEIIPFSQFDARLTPDSVFGN